MEEKQYGGKEHIGFSRIKKSFSEMAAVFGGKRHDGLAGIRAKQIREKTLRLVTALFLGYIFTATTLLFGARPLGIALFCASGGMTAAAVFSGAVIGAVMSPDPIPFLLTLTAAVCVRILTARFLTHGEIFDESPTVKAAVSAFIAFMFGLYGIIAGGFQFRPLYALLFSVILCPAAVYAFSAVLGSRETKNKQAYIRDIGICAMLFFTVYALETHGLFGFSFGIMAAFFAVICTAVTNGALRACAVGLIVGLACGAGYIPVIAAAGLACGLLLSFGLVTAVLSSVIISSAIVLYAIGYTAIFAYIGDVLFASAVFIPLAKAKLLPKLRIFGSEPEEAAGIKYSRERRKTYERSKLSALSAAFDELSDVFLELSEKQKRPSGYELREINDSICDKYCKKCALYELCWKKEQAETESVMERLISNLQDGGRATRDDLPEFFNERCTYLDRILRDTNNAAADLVEKAVNRDKTELFALDYEAMAELLEGTASEGDGESEADRELCRIASKALRGLGINAMGYGAWGTRKKTIVASGIEIGSLTVSGKDIKSTLEEQTALRLGDPKFDFNGDYVTMSVESVPTLGIESYYIGKTKDNESVSGDVLRVFDGVDHYSYALVCDGMGSGRMAALTSRISAVFLEKMLSAGNRKSVVLKMLSNFLRGKSEECHCTADLLEIDMLTSEAVFTKCGASPSYILRGENLFRIDARSIPLGITREINAVEMNMPLMPGDIIVMTSDGVSSSFDDALWLPELLAGAADNSCEKIAEMICERAAKENCPSDDMSVIIIRTFAQEAA